MLLRDTVLSCRRRNILEEEEHLMADQKPTINTYLSDMIALEKHILQPTQLQAADPVVKADSGAYRVIAEIVDNVNSHIAQLEAQLESVGGHAGSPLKEGVASVFGAFASVIDNVRKTELSKDLRDDYTALCLASVGYTMLHTTALGLGDTKTADIAKRCISDYATLVMRISDTIPTIVLNELRELGVSVNPAVAAEAQKAQEEAWKSGSARAAASV